MARPPVFLERRPYRQRRLRDAARFLPFLGLALWMVPLMWPVTVPPGGPVPPEAPLPMSVALRYVFGVWAFVVLAALVLWRRSGPEDDALSEPAPAGPDAR